MQFITTLLLTLVSFGAATLVGANAAPGMPSSTESGFATNSSNYREWPADLPLPRLSASADWTKTASIIQPWESTEFIAVKEADQWAPRLANEFGFNTVILLPPAAHNAISLPGEQITEEEFQHAVARFRAAGLKLILYTSIMHCGHDPSWQSGQLGREHPEWAMRDAAGGTVNTYGAPWLCPSTGALEYTLRCTENLVRHYQADAVMLDNNEFMKSAAGKPTCCCEQCKLLFGEYVLHRFGARKLKALLGVTPQTLRSPTGPEDPLWPLWLNWRKRVWAEALEAYRNRLRRVKPGIVVLGNTQYLYPTWMLAADAQYACEDAVLSESNWLSVEAAGAKMVLGRALAQGHPLWNYIGTFQSSDRTRLRPRDETEGLVAATLAAGANPWIVFYGFTGETNQLAVRSLANYLEFWRQHVQLFAGGRARADVAVLLSPESRDLAGESLLPIPLEELLRHGHTVTGVWEPAGWDASNALDTKVLVATAAPCMRRATAERLASWVRKGGALIVKPSTGWRDELGRQRQKNPLAEALGVGFAQPGRQVVGRGFVQCVSKQSEATKAAALVVKPRLVADHGGTLHWRTNGGQQIITIVTHTPGRSKVELRLPPGTRRVQVMQPDLPAFEAETVQSADAATASFELTSRLALVVFQDIDEGLKFHARRVGEAPRWGQPE
jgi:hypothetical protein